MMNQDVRLAAAGAGVRLWEIAAKLGVTDSTFSRKLRRELSGDEKAKIYSIIEQIVAEAD